MNENIHPDIKPARYIIIAELTSLIVFAALGIFNSFGIFMAVGVALISTIVNLFWIVRLLYNKPSKYGFYIAGLLLPMILSALLMSLLWLMFSKMH